MMILDRLKLYAELVMDKFGDDKRVIVIGLVVVAVLIVVGVFV